MSNEISTCTCKRPRWNCVAETKNEDGSTNKIFECRVCKGRMTALQLVKPL